MFLGLDLGTSAVKALLADADGNVVASRSAPLTVERPHQGWSEQDPESWWRATQKAVAELKQDLDEAVAEEKAAYDRAVAAEGGKESESESESESSGGVDLDMRVRIVDGDEVIADTAEDGDFLTTCGKFETYIQTRYR